MGWGAVGRGGEEEIREESGVKDMGWASKLLLWPTAR